MNRTVLVTGAARRIGATIVRVLAQRGHRVVIHHHESHDKALALATEIGAGGGTAFVVTGDLASSDGAEGIFVAARAAAEGVVDGLVNCASVFAFDRPPAFDAALLARLMPVNLAAPVTLACALARQEGLADGAVVNVLDQKVANLNPDFFSYSCTKIALDGATTMLAQALAPRVRVNAVSPGLSLPSHDQSEEEFRAVASQNLLRTPLSVPAIGDACDFLLRNASVTGQNIFVDNGQRFLSRTEDVMFATRPPRHD